MADKVPPISSWINSLKQNEIATKSVIGILNIVEYNIPNKKIELGFFGQKGRAR